MSQQSIGLAKLSHSDKKRSETCCAGQRVKRLIRFMPIVLSALHNCNKTKIKELYKSCRTLAADQALLDIMQIAFPLQP